MKKSREKYIKNNQNEETTRYIRGWFMEEIPRATAFLIYDLRSSVRKIEFPQDSPKPLLGCYHYLHIYGCTCESLT